MFLDNGLFVSEIQRDVFVSDKNGYISGELIPTDFGYNIALMLSERSTNVHGYVMLLQNDGDYYSPDPAMQTVEIVADQPAVLRVTDVMNQSIRAIVMERDRVIKDKTYSLSRINRVSDGLRLQPKPYAMTV